MAREIPLDESNKIVIDSFRNDEGELFLNVRKFWLKPEGAEWIPTRHGLAIHQSKVPRLIKRMKLALENIEEEARTLEPRGGAKAKDEEEKPAPKKAKVKAEEASKKKPKRRSTEEDDE